MRSDSPYNAATALGQIVGHNHTLTYIATLAIRDSALFMEVHVFHVVAPNGMEWVKNMAFRNNHWQVVS